jgi:hypothetical protein
LQESYLTNDGYQDWDFEIVITGSNGYNKGVGLEFTGTGPHMQSGEDLGKIGVVVLCLWCVVWGIIGMWRW